jgi:DMSO/TMAO reductase YedYZ molybdopterin-dependent catalytic subunit
MWIHVAAALALVPLAGWHVLARHTRPRKADLSRRVLLRTGVLTAAATGLYVATASAVRPTGLPGLERRFTGSYEAGSFDPASMPRYIWLNDSIPAVDADRWRLTVIDGEGQYQLTLADLSAITPSCAPSWTAPRGGMPSSTGPVLPSQPSCATSVTPRACSCIPSPATGSASRSTRSTDCSLRPAWVESHCAPGHGFPLRLVAPGRRSFWWVKWVDRIELQSTPPWWQPAFQLA